MPANRDAKRERQPWTGAAKQDVALPSRPLKRAGAALLGVLLLVAFAWLVWRVIRPAPRLIAATWTVGDYDLLSAPPLPFARQSLAQFRRIVGDDSIARDTATSQTDKELTAFCTDLAQYRDGSRDDLLVAFVIAHGVSLVEPAQSDDTADGKKADEPDPNSPDSATWRAVPYLLCSNYKPSLVNEGRETSSPGDPRAGMVPLDTLIDSLVACSVGHKLLLLDWGSVESDPAIGMLVNEFPALLAEKIAATRDANLWVFVSHGVGQCSLADPREKTSLFAQRVNRAWADYAERQDSREPTLAEFVEDLAKNIEESAEQLTDGALSQRPTLLWGGGKLARQSVSVLPRIPRQPPADESESAPAAQARFAPTGHLGLAVAQATGESDTTSAAAHSKPPSGERPPAEPKSGADQPSAEPNATAGAPSAPANPPGTADPKRSDGKASNTTSGKPPNRSKPAQKGRSNRSADVKNPWERRWAECDRRMIGDESGWTPLDFAPDAWRDYCERLVAAERRDDFGVAVSAAAVEQPAWDGLTKEFVNQAARYEQHQDIVQAVRLRNELLFRLPYHIRWMTAGASTADDGTLDELFPVSLFDALTGIIQTLAAPPRSGGAESAAEVARWRAQLRRHSTALEPIRQNLEQRLADEIAALTNPKSASNEGGDLPRIDNLLATPLLTGPQRAQLHQAIAKKRTGGPAAIRPAHLWRRAELEWRLNRVAGRDPKADAPDFGTRLEQFLRQAPSSNPETLVNDDQSRPELRALGDLQRVAYHRLASDLINFARATDDTARLADATLRLIDGRRAGAILKQSHYAHVDPVNLPLLPKLGIEHRIELVRVEPRESQVVALEIGKPMTLAWSVRYERPGASKLFWWLTYDDSAEDVEIAFENRPLASGQRREVTFGRGESKKELRCTVKPRREANRGPIEITLHVAAPDAPAAAEAAGPVAFGLPRHHPLRLEVAPSASALVSSLEHATLIELRPYFSPQPPDEPRPTRFRLSLANDAQLDKQVTYQWFALPSDEETLRRARDGEDIAPRSRRLAGTEKPLSISAGGGLPLDLPFPKPPAAAAGAAAPAPADASPPAPAGHDIAAGLVLDVQEVEVKGEGAAAAAKSHQRFLIQVEPKHPKEYLTPPTVVYLPNDRRLSITVEPIDASALPPEGSKIVWEIEDKRLKTAADKKTVAKLSPKVARDTMYARLPPKPDETIEVLITVDGYPRAFAYDVRCDEVAHGPSENKLEFLKNIELQIARDKSAVAAVPAAGTLIFNNVPSLQVRLRADAPRAWFARPNHRLEVGIETSDGPDGDPTTLTADRQVDIRASAGSTSGDWDILATVRDIELTLDTEGRADSRFDIVARMMPEPIEKRLTVVLDGLAPELRRMEAEVAGETISASVRAGETSDTQSGVNRVEFALLKSGDWRKAKDEGTWPKVDQPELATLGADGRWSAEFKRPPEPGNYVVLARAIDNAENESAVSDYPLTIARPRDAKAAAGDGKNSLRGTFTVRGGRPDPGANWRVSLKGPKSVGPVSGNSGSYSFKGLPPGKYELIISGDFGKIETWKKEVTIEAPPAKPTVDQWDLGSDESQAK